MKISNKVLMGRARASLTNNWKVSIGSFLIVSLISGLGDFLGFILSGPMQLGGAIFSLDLLRNKKAEFERVFDGFNNFKKAFAAYLLIVIDVIFWSLFLIIPGVVVAISYSQTFFILADNPKISAREAMLESQKIMDGMKWKFLLLGLRFFGWIILSILTLGIGFLWLIPYIEMSRAVFYEDIKK